MFKMVIGVFVFFLMNCFAATLDIPASARLSYALKFHDAFILQSYGLSTMSFNCFSEAYREALKAGESYQKVAFIEDLWKWYRIHGSAMRLFAKEPTGGDRFSWSRTEMSYEDFFPPTHFSDDVRGFVWLVDLPSSPLSEISQYHSECGRTPEQARHIRTFLFGTGQVIGGIFCITTRIPVAIGAGVTLVANGASLIFTSLNDVYADYERAKFEMQILEARAKKVVEIP